MKIKSEHYDHMVKEINRFIYVYMDEIPRHIKTVIHFGKYQNLKKRIRWDICTSAGLLDFITGTLYVYLNDTHIDTALRSIMADYDFYKELK